MKQQYSIETFYLYFKEWNNSLNLLIGSRIVRFRDQKAFERSEIKRFSCEGRDFIKSGKDIIEY